MSNDRKAGRPTKSFWVCWRPKDALDGMHQLKPAEELAYRRILDMIFATDDQLHDDDEALAWSTRAGKRWRAVKAALVQKGKIVCADGFIRNARATETCIETRAFRAQRVAAAEASHQSPKRLKNKETASAAAATAAPASGHANHQLPLSEELRSSARGTAEGDLFGDPAAGDPPPNAEAGGAKTKPTANGLLHDEGLRKLGQMTGREPDKERGFLGTLKRDAKGDASLVLAAIQHAHRLWLDEATEITDARAWLRRVIQERAGRKRPPEPAPVPEVAGGFYVAVIVAECERITHACCETVWPGFSRVVADALESGADTDRHVFPAMRQAARFGVERIHSAGWFRDAIAGLRGRDGRSAA